MSPTIQKLQAAARIVVLSAEKASDLTIRLVCAQVEEQLGLTESLRKDERFRGPIKIAIQSAIDERHGKKAKETISEDPVPAETKPVSAPAPKEQPESATNRAKSSTVKSSSDPFTSAKGKYKSASVVATSESEQDEPTKVASLNISQKPKSLPRHLSNSSKPKPKPRPVRSEMEEPEPKGVATNRLSASSSSRDRGTERATISIRDDDDNDSDSEVEERPPKRKRKKTSDAASEKPTPKKRTKKTESKDEATVKKLKSYVFACGIRKPWAKILKGVDEPSKQINIIRKILTDLGMTGRPSLEQAKRIKERREIAQDLEEVQTFEMQTQARSSRRSNKTDTDNHPPAESDADEDDGEGDEEAMENPVRRKNARQRILAFLQDQSD